MIAYGLPRPTLDELFASVKEVGRIGHPLADESENDLPVYVCRQPRRALSEAWPELRHYDHVSRLRR